MQTEPWNADLLDWLAANFAEGGYDLKKTMELICTSQAYQSKSQVLPQGADEHGYVYGGPRAKRLTAEQFVDTIWQLTQSAPTKFDAPVLRGKLDAKAPAATKLQAQWIWGESAGNGKLPPSDETIAMHRVFEVKGEVARAGAVAACDNEYTLYVNGRELAKSTVWMNVGAVSLEGALKKGGNEILVIAKNGGKGPNAAGLFFEAHLRMQDGREQVISSDASWEWSKTLPDGKGKFKKPAEWKPAVIVPALPTWSQTIDAPAASLLAQLTTEELPMVRAGLLKSDFLMRTLGRPNRDQIVSMRPNDLSTLEAIDLANGSILANALSTGAKKLLARPWTTPDALVNWTYHFALSRNPTADELATAKEALGTPLNEQGIQDLLWAVCMLPEFQLVR
jgi:hypothetical protein